MSKCGKERLSGDPHQIFSRPRAEGTLHGQSQSLIKSGM